VRGAFLTSQAVLRPMMKARRGSIIFISSVIGQMGNAGQTAYSATKAALLGMTKSLAREVGSRGIRVNAITPGFIKTDMTSALPDQNKEGILAQIPLGTLGEPEDIAKAVAFLASPASKYVTGQVLAVNGGLYM
ncbi:MAG: SDR family oxidoreductase, partial [Deltaproteobacteria bacterium]|nr:SDR family oxidoreductase [Deltaproteobacteria bacterium]